MSRNTVENSDAGPSKLWNQNWSILNLYVRIFIPDFNYIHTSIVSYWKLTFHRLSSLRKTLMKKILESCWRWDLKNIEITLKNRMKSLNNVPIILRIKFVRQVLVIICYNVGRLWANSRLRLITTRLMIWRFANLTLSITFQEEEWRNISKNVKEVSPCSRRSHLFPKSVLLMTGLVT